MTVRAIEDLKGHGNSMNNEGRASIYSAGSAWELGWP